jgi:hypothetical protein
LPSLSYRTDASCQASSMIADAHRHRRRDFVCSCVSNAGATRAHDRNRAAAKGRDRTSIRGTRRAGTALSPRRFGSGRSRCRRRRRCRRRLHARSPACCPRPSHWPRAVACARAGARLVSCRSAALHVVDIASHASANHLSLHPFDRADVWFVQWTSALSELRTGYASAPNPLVAQSQACGVLAFDPTSCTTTPTTVPGNGACLGDMPAVTAAQLPKRSATDVPLTVETSISGSGCGTTETRTLRATGTTPWSHVLTTRIVGCPPPSWPVPSHAS